VYSFASKLFFASREGVYEHYSQENLAEL